VIRLSGFADEIAADPAVQIEVLQSEGIRFLELRGAWGKNVLDFSDTERQDLRRRLHDAGIGVSAIGSPIGKVPIDESWPDHAARFKIALDAAKFFEAPYIRVFSYFRPKVGDIADHREEVIRRLNEQVAMARGRPVRLLNENEGDVYASTTERCLDLLENVPDMDMIFDPANFIQAGVRPAEAWPRLADRVAYFHIKDAILGTGQVVPAGEGDGALAETLRDAIRQRGYEGYLSLEPHLAAAGQFSGFSGPDLFKQAVRALKRILNEIGAAYS